MGNSARRFIVTIVVATLVALAGASAAEAVTFQDQVTSSTNAQRAAASVRPLLRDPALDSVAQAWADQMSRTGQFAHSTAEWRAARIPSGWDSNGENIAYGYSSAASVMDAWMKSAGHKDNILRGTYTRIGVGYVATGKYWVQVFGGYKKDRAPDLAPAALVAVAGTPRVGQTLTANAGSWGSGVSLAYQWKVNGVSRGGATGPTVKPTALDVGSTFSVTITGSKAGFAPTVRTSAPTGAVTTNLAVSRITGPDRYTVASTVARSAFPGRAGVVFVASGLDYPDALSASPAAIELGGPLVLTQPTGLPASTRSTITSLGPSTIVVVGGTASVSDAVVQTLRELAPEVIRIAGADRYDVSRAMADYAFADQGAATAYVSTGSNFPDALSAGSAAGSAAAPVLLVKGLEAPVDERTRTRVGDLGVRSVKIAGGPASVTPGAADSLAAAGRTVTRLSGADRFDASISINADAYKQSRTAYLATGYNYPDALAGSVLAGVTNAPLFVVRATCVPRGVLAQFDALGVTQVVLLGGPASLSPEVQSLIACAS